MQEKAQFVRNTSTIIDKEQKRTDVRGRTFTPWIAAPTFRICRTRSFFTSAHNRAMYLILTFESSCSKSSVASSMYIMFRNCKYLLPYHSSRFDLHQTTHMLCERLFCIAEVWADCTSMNEAADGRNSRRNCNCLSLKSHTHPVDFYDKTSVQASWRR